MYMPLHASAEKTKSKNAPTIRHRDTERERDRDIDKQKATALIFVLVSESFDDQFIYNVLHDPRKEFPSARHRNSAVFPVVVVFCFFFSRGRAGA
jgi:hypothetical protein